MYLPIGANLIPMNADDVAIGNAETPVPVFDKDISLFSRCKEATYALLTRLDLPTKRALLPAYTCETVIEPFRQDGWAFAFYPLDLHMHIQPAAFRKLLREFKPTLVYTQALYGMDLNETELTLLREAKDVGCFVLEDMTQAAFSTRRDDVVDAYVGSLRKWFPMPEGGFLRSNTLRHLDDSLEDATHYIKYNAAALQVYRVYLATGDQALLNSFRLLEDTAKEPIITPHRMSDSSRRIYAVQDQEANNRQRMENCRYLFEHLQDCKSCKPVYASLDDMTTGPLWFPVYVQDKKEFIRDCGRKYRFSAPGLWPVETPDVLVDDMTRFQYDHTVAITCAHIYNTAHMARIVEGFRAWDSEVVLPE